MWRAAQSQRFLRSWVLRASVAGTLAAACPCLKAQEIQLDQNSIGISARQRVEPITTAVAVKAGRPSWIEVRFRVQAGFHINSHTPHDELLVPTVLEINGPPQVMLSGQQYPAGIPLRLEVGSGGTLSTYQGEFAVKLQVTAPGGESELRGNLSYQACDARSCFPPKKLPVQVTLHSQ